MKKPVDHAFDWIALAGFAAIPVTIFWQTATSLSEQGVASGGPMANAAFYPEILAWILSALVAIHAIRLATGRVSKPSPLTAGPEIGRALITTGLFVVYLLAMPVMGFHIVTPLLCLGLLLLYRIPPLWAVPGALILWLGSAFIFEGLLNVVLPVGVFGIAIFN